MAIAMGILCVVVLVGIFAIGFARPDWPNGGAGGGGRGSGRALKEYADGPFEKPDNEGDLL